MIQYSIYTVSGINAVAPISITGGSYSVNGTSFTTGSGAVNNGNTVAVRLTSSGNFSTQTCATLNISGVHGSFCVTTQPAPAHTPSVSINNVSQNEGNAGTTPFNFNMTLSSASSQSVTVSYNTSNGTAVGGANCTGSTDYKSLSSMLTFTPGQTSKSISVQICGDTIPEPNETFAVTLTSASNAAIATGQGAGVGTIVNDDSCIFLSKPTVDFDGDCESDIGIYRNGAWSIRRSSDDGVSHFGWGGPSWGPAVADYDGDGKADVAVYHSSGVWSIVRSSDGGNTVVGWGGAPQDIPLN